MKVKSITAPLVSLFKKKHPSAKRIGKLKTMLGGNGPRYPLAKKFCRLADEAMLGGMSREDACMHAVKNLNIIG